MTSPQKIAVGRILDHLEMLKETGQKEIEVDMAKVRGLKKVLAGVKKPKAIAFEPTIPLTLQKIAARVAECQRCGLCKTRTNTVPGQGNPHPELMFIGEGPGADEDEQGLAFVGRAGQLLTKIIEAMGFTRDEVFIGNIVKCRPPDNRVPEDDEMESCIPYLKEQIAVLKPKVIVCLGATAVKGLFGPDMPGITKLRGQWQTFEGIDVMPTLHPAYLLRNPPVKKDLWEDMKVVVAKLGRRVPVR
jgi:uracil-DNA glycosylase